MKTIKIITLCIIIAIAVFSTLVSAVYLFLYTPENISNTISAWLGIAGMVASVLLSILAMVYSNKSAKNTETTLVQITDQYKILCDDLRKQAIDQGLGINGINRIVEKNRLASPKKFRDKEKSKLTKKKV